MRAAKLSHVPGVTLAEACARFGVTRAAIARARKLPAARPSLGELALAALTTNGTVTTGNIDLAGITGWIDHINHDGTTADDVRALLEPFVAAGSLVLEGERWRLVGEWP